MEMSVFSTPMFFRGVFVALIVIAAAADARAYRIPNLAVLALAAMGVVALLMRAPELIISNLLLAATALLVGYFLYRFTGLGAGDAKLISAIMVWFGAAGATSFLFWLGACAGVLAASLLIARRIWPSSSETTAPWRPLEKGAPVPFAVAIGPAAIIASLQFDSAIW